LEGAGGGRVGQQDRPDLDRTTPSPTRGPSSSCAAALGGPVSVQARTISLLHYLFIAAGAGGPLELDNGRIRSSSDRVVGGTALWSDGLAGPMRERHQAERSVIKIEHVAVLCVSPHQRSLDLPTK